MTDLHMHPVPKEVPYSLTGVVCTCSSDSQQHALQDSAYSRKKTGEGAVPPDAVAWARKRTMTQHVCKKCWKYYRYTMRTCCICEEPFVMSFRHVNYCIMRPTCWNCTENFPEPACDHEGCRNQHKVTALFVPEDLDRKVAPTMSSILDSLDFDEDDDSLF